MTSCLLTKNKNSKSEMTSLTSEGEGFGCSLRSGVAGSAERKRPGRISAELEPCASCRRHRLTGRDAHRGRHWLHSCRKNTGQSELSRYTWNLEFWQQTLLEEKRRLSASTLRCSTKSTLGYHMIQPVCGGGGSSQSQGHRRR